MRRWVLVASLVLVAALANAESLTYEGPWANGPPRWGPIGSLAFVGSTRSVVFVAREGVRHASLDEAGATTTLFRSSHLLAAAALSPGGRHLIVATASVETLSIVNVESGAVERLLSGSGEARVLTWSGDGERILVSTTEGELAVIDVRVGRPVLRAFTYLALAAGFRPDGRSAFVVSTQGAVELYDLEKLSQVDSFEVEPRAHAAAVSADGRTLALAVGTKLLVRDWKARDVRWSASFKEPLVALALSSDGRLVAAVDGRGQAHVLAVGGPELPLGSGHAGDVRSIAVSPGGRRAVSTGADGRVELWDAAEGTLVHPLRCGPAIGPASFTPDGSLVLVPTNEGVLEIEPESRRLVRRIAAPPAVNGVTLDPESGELAMLGSASVTYWHEGARRLETHPCEGRPLRALDGRRVLLLRTDGRGSGRFVRLDLGTGKEQVSADKTVGRVEALAWTPDGRRALVATEGLEVWDMTVPSRVRSFENAPGVLGAVGVSRDGRLGAALHTDRHLRVWALDGTWAVADLELREFEIPTAIEFGPDAEWLLLGTCDGRIHKVTLRRE